MPSEYALEEQSGAGYKRIHRAGCRDLRDPESLGSAASPEELLSLLDGYGSAEDLEELAVFLAPCARETLNI